MSASDSDGAGLAGFSSHYARLRQIATARLHGERNDITLSPTGLVHEAYLRLADHSVVLKGPDAFLAAAATTMRRVLVDRARRIRTAKRGGGRIRVDLPESAIAETAQDVDLEALDEALDVLEERFPKAAQLVELRYFTGLTTAQAAEAIGISLRTADRQWAFARAWLKNWAHRKQLASREPNVGKDLFRIFMNFAGGNRRPIPPRVNKSRSDGPFSVKTTPEVRYRTVKFYLFGGTGWP